MFFFLKIIADKDYKKTELLPLDWNSDHNVYDLLYTPANVSKIQAHVMKVVRAADDLVIVHFMVR